mgnify:CR=1 FL=1|jgi:hypothetical protein|tara:strand:- start:6539 stop:7135 length:597 start_codon:yes stop_codon:yes gene_type:complete
MIFQKGGLCKYNTITQNWEIGNNLGRRARIYSSNEAEALNLLGLTSSHRNGLTQYYRDTNVQQIWGLNKIDTKTLSQIIDEIVKYAKTNNSSINEAIGLLVAAREGREQYPAENEDKGHAEYREGINRLIHLLSESQRNNGFIGNRNTSNRNRSTSKRNSRRNSRSRSNSKSRRNSKSRNNGINKNGGNKKMRLTKKK